ncbi:MAG: chorismate mutase [Stappiaceae bacterium]
MHNKPPKSCQTMDDVRREIDRLDNTLVDLLSDRFAYVRRAAQIKDGPNQASVPWRVQQVVDKVRARSEEKNLPPELAELVWRQMIEWFIRYEEETIAPRKLEKPFN